MDDFNFDALDIDNIDFDDLTSYDIHFREEEKPQTKKERQALYRKALKRTEKRIKKRDSLKKALTRLPEPNEECHIIGEGTYDFFTWIPVIQDIVAVPLQLYASTWTMNRDNVVELFDLFDSGKLSSISILTGLYFQQRESSVFSSLITGIRKRQQRYTCFKNHTKITLLSHADLHLCIMGSANFTANPRTEQYIMVNDRQVFDFYRNWFEEMFTLYPI